MYLFVESWPQVFEKMILVLVHPRYHFVFSFASDSSAHLIFSAKVRVILY